jgi:nucleoside-diphosphate kinase
MEQTLVLIKPDGVQRGLIGPIITRLEQRGLQLVALKLIQISPELAARHYAEHQGKPFYDKLITYITSGPSVALVWQGLRAVDAVRKTVGKTHPVDAEPGTIRGDLALEIGRNLIHASDGLQKAEAEVALFFTPQEFVDWSRTSDPWIRE